MKKRRRVDRSERRTAELARTLQKENQMLRLHKNFIENFAMRQRLEAAQRIRNQQNEYGALREALQRIPPGLQKTAVDRMKALGDSLTQAKTKYPINFPAGAMP